MRTDGDVVNRMILGFCLLFLAAAVSCARSDPGERCAPGPRSVVLTSCKRCPAPGTRRSTICPYHPSFCIDPIGKCLIEGRCHEEILTAPIGHCGRGNAAR